MSLDAITDKLKPLVPETLRNTAMIRLFGLAKVPLILVCGKKEEKDKTLTVRTLGSDKQETLKREELIKRITQSNKMPAN